jgi:hypothetical protein
MKADKADFCSFTRTRFDQRFQIRDAERKNVDDGQAPQAEVATASRTQGADDSA